MARQSGSTYQQVASYGYSAELDEYMTTHPIAIGRGTLVGRTVLERTPVQIEDVLADPEYTFKDAAQIGNYRTALGVPLLREGVPIGVFYLARSTTRPFTEKQIELATTFADQAVIAIENVRLFEAEQQRTRELAESLEQQTATSEVLQVISSSPGDLQPVFETMLEKAVSICDANFGNIYRWDGNALHLAATHNTPPALADSRRHSPLRPSSTNLVGRMLATKAVVHVANLANENVYVAQREPSSVAAVELGGIRTLTNCDSARPTSRSLCSSRLRLPRCLRSSAVRRENWNRCSEQCWIEQCASARRGSAIYICARAMASARR
jgi:hypothetical protein